MTIERVLATAASGLKANARKVQVAATNIVNLGTVGYKAVEVRTISRNSSSLAGANGNGVITELALGNRGDLVLEFTRLIEAEAAYKASASVIRTSEELQRAVIDIMA
jgi:flagellar basal body rod protein FlgG